MYHNGRVQIKSWQNYWDLSRIVSPRKVCSKNFHDDMHSSISYSLKENRTPWSQAWQCPPEVYWQLRTLHYNRFWDILQAVKRFCYYSEWCIFSFLCLLWATRVRRSTSCVRYLVPWYQSIHSHGKESTLPTTWCQQKIESYERRSKRIIIWLLL